MADFCFIAQGMQTEHITWSCLFESQKGLKNPSGSQNMYRIWILGRCGLVGLQSSNN